MTLFVLLGRHRWLVSCCPYLFVFVLLEGGSRKTFLGSSINLGLLCVHNTLGEHKFLRPVWPWPTHGCLLDCSENPVFRNYWYTPYEGLFVRHCLGLKTPDYWFDIKDGLMYYTTKIIRLMWKMTECIMVCNVRVAETIITSARLGFLGCGKPGHFYVYVSVSVMHGQGCLDMHFRCSWFVGVCLRESEEEIRVDDLFCTSYPLDFEVVSSVLFVVFFCCVGPSFFLLCISFPQLRCNCNIRKQSFDPILGYSLLPSKSKSHRSSRAHT